MMYEKPEMEIMEFELETIVTIASAGQETEGIPEIGGGGSNEWPD